MDQQPSLGPLITRSSTRGAEERPFRRRRQPRPNTVPFRRQHRARHPQERTVIVMWRAEAVHMDQQPSLGPLVTRSPPRGAEE